MSELLTHACRCEGRIWTVRLICCDHDAGIARFATWSEAAQYRLAWVDPVPGSTHDRVGIVERCPGCDES